MANNEQLEILRQGIKVWNLWRKRNANRYVDLKGADLTGADLKGADLAGTSLFKALLAEADLRGAILREADLRVADLRKANLKNADLTHGDLREANLTEAFLNAANLSQADLVAANLTGVSLAHADLTGATLAEACLRGADLTYTDLHGADLTGADLTAASLADAQNGRFAIEQIQQAIGVTIADDSGLRRSLEFPPEYKAAGIGILTHFGEVLKAKYRDLEAKVTIEQDGNTVTMIVTTEDGEELGKIEKTFEEYGLVVLGQKSPEELFPNDPMQVVALKSEIRMMQIRVENQRELLAVQDRLLENQRVDIEDLKALIGTVARRPTAPVTVQVVAGNFTTHLPALQAGISELQKELPENPDLDQAATDLKSLEGETDPERVKSHLERVRQVLENLGDEKSLTSKTLRGAQKVVRAYNSIAELCGMPVVPSFLVGKK